MGCCDCVNLISSAECGEEDEADDVLASTPKRRRDAFNGVL